MEIPDKIYLYREKPKDYFNEDWHELSANDVENIEYIRKDFLLEWTKEQSASCNGSVAMKRAYDKLIDKLNSM